MSSIANPSGVQFPTDAKGQRSTTSAGKKIWAAAASLVDQKAADALTAEKDWRYKYGKHVMALADLQMKSPEVVLSAARAGLESVYSSFEFIRDGKTWKLSEAMESLTSESFSTWTIQGSKTLDSADCKIVLPFKGKTQESADVLKTVTMLSDAGALEPDVAAAMTELHAHPEWLDLSQKVFVLIGATSEMCPFKILLSLGATVVAIARPSKRLNKLVEQTRSSPGTLILPLSSPQTEGMSDEDVCKLAGADVLTQTPEIRNWLLSVAAGKQLVIGSYIYLDGEAHVRASVAMDAIVSGVCKGRPGCALTYLATPSNGYPIPQDAYEDSKKRLKNVPWWHGLMSTLLGHFDKSARPQVPSADGTTQYCIFDGLTIVQGPNYALAKTIQNWRCILAREEGILVSANMAPASKTDSVMHVKTVAQAMNGMEAFEPLTAFEADTAAALMAYLLIYDLGCPTSPANPATKLDHPMMLFSSLGVHGGMWRCPWTMNSLGKASYVMGFFR